MIDPEKQELVSPKCSECGAQPITINLTPTRLGQFVMGVISCAFCGHIIQMVPLGMAEQPQITLVRPS